MAIIIWAVSATALICFLLWRLYRIKREIYSYTNMLEKCLDDIISEREIECTNENRDNLYGKINEKLCRISYIFKKKEEKSRIEKQKLKEMLSDISHQTKTPIANIKVYLEMLSFEKLSEKEREFTDNITEQTEKLDFLLQSMVKMSRMEAGVIQIQTEEEYLFDTLGRAIAAIVPKAEQKGIKLYVECSEEIRVSHDKKWTEEALFNILDNGVKYTDIGGSIKIIVSVGEIFTKISIKDSGKGIAAERQAEIFKRFYREPEVHGIEGLGLGLYLSRKIIELQNGYIEVRSQIGKGSDFQIYLPNE